MARAKPQRNQRPRADLISARRNRSQTPKVLGGNAATYGGDDRNFTFGGEGTM